MIRVFMLLILKLCSFYATFSQDLMKEVYIGDAVPELTIEDVLYVENNRIETKDFIGKAVIIEFGTTYCGPCLESFKKMNVFKEQYGDEVDFYMVTPQKESAVKKFFSFQGLDTLTNVPVITNDTVLQAIFRHVAIPHLVWVDRQGKVKAVTDHHYLTTENIDAFLTERELQWPVKWDFPYDRTQKMLVFNPANFHEINKPKRYFSAVITDHLEGVLRDAGTAVDSTINEEVIYGRNLTRLQSYLRHFSRRYDSNIFASQIVIDTVDARKYFYDSSKETMAEWNMKNTFSYEFIFPFGYTDARKDEIILKQLDTYFNIKTTLKEVKRRCWVLYYSPQLKRMDASGLPKARTVAGLLRAINRIPFHAPLVLSEDFDGLNVNDILFLLDSDYSNLETMNKDLAPYGLYMREQEKEIESLIIEKTN